jgi:hypothetical protein
VSGKDLCDFVLMDFIPAGTSGGIIDVHKAGMQISGKREAFIEDQCYAIVAVPRRMDDFAIQADAGKKSSAVFEFQNQVVMLCDGNVGEVFSFEIFSKGRNEVSRV